MLSTLDTCYTKQNPIDPLPPALAYFASRRITPLPKRRPTRAITKAIKHHVSNLNPGHSPYHANMARPAFLPFAPLRPCMTRRSSQAISKTPRMVVLSDEEKRHILQPSPYQHHRRQKYQLHSPPPPPETPRPTSFPSHTALLEALHAIRGDPLESHGGRIVGYRGNADAEIMVIGEAPGEQEDLEGVPFVGKAGKLLDKIFAYGGFDMEKQVYITNVVKRRPPGNRNPTRAEIEYFLPYLLEEVRLVDPKLVVLAGSIAAKAMLGPHLRITKDRGTWFELDGRWVIPVLHPSYLLRVEVAKYDMVKDIEAIREKFLEIVPGVELQPLQKKKASERRE